MEEFDRRGPHHLGQDSSSRPAHRDFASSRDTDTDGTNSVSAATVQQRPNGGCHFNTISTRGIHSFSNNATTIRDNAIWSRRSQLSP